MARQRFASCDEEHLIEQKPFVPMDGLFSSSWPAAAPLRHRPEPPLAPLRKPSNVDWEVPPLALPTGPRKRSASSSSTTLDGDSLRAAPLDEPEEDDEDENGAGEEDGVFAFEGHRSSGALDDEEDDFGQFKLELVGLDDEDEPLTGCLDCPDVMFSGDMHDGPASFPSRTSRSPPTSLAQGRERSQSVNVSTGASPVLLSALERVAAEAGVPEGRLRLGTV